MTERGRMGGRPVPGTAPAVRAGDLSAAAAPATVIVDAAGIVRAADAAAAALLGRASAQLEGRPLLAVAGPEMAGRVARLLAAAADEARAAPVDLDLPGPDRRPRSIRLTATAHGGPEGAVHVTVRDVTPEKRAGARARDGDAILREAVEAYPDAVAIVRPVIAASGRLEDVELVYANTFARERYLAGRDLGAVTGLRLFGALPALRGILVRAFAHVHRTGRPIRRQVYVRTGGDDAISELTIAPVAAGLLVVGRVNAREVRARAELADARDAFRRLAENASDIVTEVAADGTLAWVSPSASAALGLAPATLAGMALAALVHPEDREALGGAAVTGGALRHAEVRLRAPGDGWRWYRAAIRARRDAAGASAGATIGWQDVDAEVRARTAASVNEERLRRLMDALPDPAVIWRPVRAAGGAIVGEEPLWVNRAFVALAGLDAALAEALALAPPGRVWVSLHALHARALATGRAERSQVRLGGERILETESIPLGDGTLLVSVRDVTAERRAAAVLERSLRGLGEAQRIGHLGSWTLDPATGAMAWSDEMARIHGLRPGAVAPDLDAYLAFLEDPVERAQLRAAMDRSLQGGEGYAMEHGILRPDGVRLRLVARGEMRRDPEDGRMRLHGTVLDITERYRVREARTRRVARRSDYLAQAAHVLRTELALVAGWSELLADADAAAAVGAEDRRRAVEAIARSAPRLARLVDAILDEAAETARAEALEPVPTDVALLAADVVQDHGERRAGIAIRAEPPAGVTALAAPDALATVLRHLLENALHHARSAIVVRSARGPEGTEISVRDDGPGFPPGVDPFRPFLRGEGSRGHGLGLHVVRTLTEGMGGRAMTVPHPPGTGAEIVLVLPPDDTDAR